MHGDLVAKEIQRRKGRAREETIAPRIRVIERAPVTQSQLQEVTEDMATREIRMRKPVAIRRVIGVLGIATRLLVTGGVAYCDIKHPPAHNSAKYDTLTVHRTYHPNCMTNW